MKRSEKAIADIEGGRSVIAFDVAIVTILTVTIIMVIVTIILTSGCARTSAYLPLHIHLSVVAPLRHYLLDSCDGLQERGRG